LTLTYCCLAYKRKCLESLRFSFKGTAISSL
jgi:hypothetical protein